MKFSFSLLVVATWLIAGTRLFGQSSANCFLEDFEPKNAEIPPYEEVEKTIDPATMTVTVNAADTTGRVSKYVFGTACAVWVGQNINNPILVNYLQKLAPTLIRFPGGSWSDIYFWNGNPGNLPSTIPNGQNNGQPMGLNPQFGPNYPLTPDSYYDLRDQIYSQGLITINYGYARYGTGEKPAEDAAHVAADWVRYDDGRTLFWEIGNENGGPWEAGWQIDTTRNKDGQPEFISGALYGQHFKIFADSMRAAAAERNNTIYIGGQVLHYNGINDNWNPPNKAWNEGFFREVGDAADFYLMHNYFGSVANARALLDQASTVPKQNIDFIRQDIAAKKAAVRPIAITEYNMGDAGALAGGSFIKGMQAVILFCEFIKSNFGLASRWLIANWEADGTFYFRNPTQGGIPLWNPRPEYFYTYYLQRFFGDHAITATSSKSDVLAYASTFNSGETGVVVVNKGTTEQVVTVNLNSRGVGERYYIYSLIGGTDNGEFSQVVYVNDEGPNPPTWGPIEVLDDIPARAYQIGGEIKFVLPSRSVQFVMIEGGNNTVSVHKDDGAVVGNFKLHQNYPNPFNPETEISYVLPQAGRVMLEIYDISGRIIKTLGNVNQQKGDYTVRWDAKNESGKSVASGVYIYKIRLVSSGKEFADSKKMVFVK